MRTTLDHTKPRLSAAALALVVLAALLSMGTALAAVPTNDDFDAATLVGALPYSTSLDTSEATPALDDPYCVADAEATVWFAFTAPEDQRLTANTFGSDYDTILSAYTGTRGGLTRVACNDDAGSDLQSKVAFDAVGGTTYYFMVGDYGLGGQLNFSLERARVATDLRLTTSKTRVYPGESVRVTAHLDAYQDATNREVSIFRTPTGGSRQLIATGAVNASGNLTVNVSLKKTSKFQAEWGGDENYLPATSKRKTVYFGVKSGSWYGSTRQGWGVELRVEDGVKVTRMAIIYIVRWNNCAGKAMVELDVRLRPAATIHDDRLRIEWNIPPIKGSLKGTFTSRSRIKGTLNSTINDPQIGCRGSLDDLRWNASRF